MTKKILVTGGTVFVSKFVINCIKKLLLKIIKSELIMKKTIHPTVLLPESFTYK